MHEKKVIYECEADLVPRFVIPTGNGSYFFNPLSDAEKAALKKEREKPINQHYQISILGTKYSGTTTHQYNLKEFYDGAVREGVTEYKKPNQGN
jgi:hypothetical protein